MAHSARWAANSVLELSFRDGVYITPRKLQKLLYLIASEYQKGAGRPLLEEKFLTWAYGPVLYSVHDKFASLPAQGIDHFIPDITGKSHVISQRKEPHFSAALHRIWNRAGTMDELALIELTRAPGSAWDIAFQCDNYALDPDDIGADDTYRARMGLTPFPVPAS